jgi:uncharacterized protein (DUF2141 family)
MKTCRLHVFAVLLLLVLTASASAMAQGTIIVRVVAFRAATGNIHLSLYNKEERFPDKDMRIRLLKVPVTNSSVVEMKFENVPYGTYAIAGLHDENRSGDMDYTWMGMPKEGYCFSNDAKPFLSAPSFSEAKFKLDKPQKIVQIAMQY